MSLVFNKFTGNSENWDNYLNQFSNFSFSQTYDWGEFKKKCGWDVLRLIQYNHSNNIISLSQILYNNKFGLMICWIPGGPVGDVLCWSKEILNYITTLNRALA